MKLIKVKGIVVKEVGYGDNDKIITLLTDSLGLISCMAKGARRTKSSLLAASQYLVYSEFVLFKGTTFYHINSAEVDNTFYSLKLDLEKLENIYKMTKAILFLTNENIDTKDILKVFLNSLHFIKESKRNILEIVNLFLIKMVALLGFAPNVNSCNICHEKLMDKKEKVYYDYVSNLFVCSSCVERRTSRQIEISYPCYMYIRYIILLDISKIFSISLNDNYINELNIFGQALIDCIKSSV